MGTVTLPSFGTDPATVNAANLDAKVDPLASEFNGNIENVNIKSDAAIAASKLNLATIAQVMSMSSKDFSEAKGADVASDTTTTIWVTDGNYLHITGTTTITSFGTAGQAGDERTVVFDGILTLTHNATSLILPTGANITTAAGDTAIVRAETTANARVVAYIRKDGTALTGTTHTAANALAGSVVQVVNKLLTTVVTDTTHIAWTQPAVTTSHGTEAFSQAYTALSTTNKLLIRVVLRVTSPAVGDNCTIALFDTLDAAPTNAIATTSFGISGGSFSGIGVLEYFMTATSVSARTFSVRFGLPNNTSYTNSISSGTEIHAGKEVCSLTIIEVKA